MSNGWYTAGHCQDIDGFLVHDPGQCPGAVVNCNRLCCGPRMANCPVHGDYIYQIDCPKCIKEVMEWTG